MELNNLSRRDFLKLSGTSIAAASLGPLSGCISNEKTAMKLGYQPPALGQQAPYQVMKHKNYTDKYNFDIKPTKCTWGAEVVQAYARGAINIGQSGNFPALTVLSKNIDTTIIGNYDLGKKVYAFATTETSDVNINNLKGKTIAFPTGSTAEWFIREVIQDKTDLSFKDVEFMNSGPQNAVVSLSQGTADAAVFWHPWIERAEEDVGIDILSWGYGTDYYLLSPIYVRDSYLENHEDTVQNYMNAMVRALKYIHNNVDQVAEWISNAESGQVDKPLAKRALNVVLGRTEVGNEDGFVPWHSEYDQILQRAADFRRNKMSKDFPELDVTKYIETKYTKKAIQKEAPDLFGDIEI
ncbi:MAG: ABC-type nitrate/sulfonate/bicarbonate transport system periplasmic component [Candidatus Methanohalarchaeum thermophilum]|uniref:ABC-type nitrate/sulfonate/bicarbonate transport system periplasmic component n=1 Tax=Methanohalarchaeum thermophilum TaxID=1903181 RepID=A0A1Q6DU47_METT1|nr:MAG: ABC-type nitrate/sulfonate/bicarbonate transport system periplasmic component [Candidatus Methanohalarchaeum thermophilum]